MEFSVATAGRKGHRRRRRHETAEPELGVSTDRAAVATDAVDENGWPVGFFELVAGSIPDLRRGSQGQFEERLPLE
jgi:hypothetical protein